jgi:hypothetical protein
MLRRYMLAGAALLAFCIPGMLASQTAPVLTPSSESLAEVDRLGRSVTDALIAGDAKRVVDAFAAGSPLMAGKTIELGSLQSQIQTSLTAYGSISSIELAKQQTLGTSAIRRYYVARHEKLTTRWELVFARTSKGWVIGYLGFDDQQRGWFE